MAKKEKYVIDGHTYEIEIGENHVRGNPELWSYQQSLKINDQEVTIYANTDNKDSEIYVFAENQSNDKFINDVDREEYRNYKGLGAKELYKVLEERVAKGHATPLEQCAVYSLNYNEMKKAELRAKGVKDNDMKHSYVQFTAAQFSGEESLPDLAKTFPWAYANENVISLDNKMAKISIIGQAARFRNSCRRELNDIKSNRSFNTTSEFKEAEVGWLAQNDMHDILSNQRKMLDTKNKISTNANLDAGTEELVALLEKKNKKSKINSSKTQQPFYPKENGNSLS